MLLQLPKWVGKSRLADPLESIHKIALKTVKGFKPGRPVDFSAGNSGLFFQIQFTKDFAYVLFLDFTNKL